MLVRDRMTTPAITMDVKGSIAEAHSLMRHYAIRRIPVLHKDRLVGIVTWTDLMAALPSPASTLGAWEVPGLLRRASVKEIMTSDPVTVDPGDPIEEAAFLMRRWKIGGLPVVKDGVLVGVITESDIFDAFVDLTGVRQGGARLIVDLTGHATAIAEVAAFVESMGVNLLSIATYKQNDSRLAVIRVDAQDPFSVADALAAKGYRVLHYVAATGLPGASKAAVEPRQPAWPMM